MYKVSEIQQILTAWLIEWSTVIKHILNKYTHKTVMYQWKWKQYDDKEQRASSIAWKI